VVDKAAKFYCYKEKGIQNVISGHFSSSSLDTTYVNIRLYEQPNFGVSFKLSIGNNNLASFNHIFSF
jgi:hypothetical protein